MRLLATLSAHPALATLLVSGLLLAPSLLLGLNFNDSSKYNFVWGEQFATLVRAGSIYPRWLPGAFDGMGSPTFYFYPPLGFLLDAAVSVVTLDALPVGLRLSVTSTAILWGSGFFMYRWLAETTDRDTALLGAIAYMGMPYHMLDHYLRGAFAEFACYAVLPILMLSVRRAAAGGGLAWAGMATAYGALVLAHLPTAVLTSVTALPLYCLFLAWRSGSRRAAILVSLRCASAAVLGLGLTAAYLIPALLLQRWISADQLWTQFFAVENWFVFAPARWLRPQLMWIITALAIGAGFAVIGILISLIAARRDDRRTEAGFWAVLCLVCLLLLTGAVPSFWRVVPFVAKVQFPWRLMTLVDFALVTAACLAIRLPLGRVAAGLFSTAAVAMLAGVLLIGKAGTRAFIDSWHGWSQFERDAMAHRPDANEYLPAGFSFPPAESGMTDVLASAAAREPAVCEPARCTAEDDATGGLIVHVVAQAPAIVVLRRFYFPAWLVTRGAPAAPIATAPMGPWRLLSFPATPGENTYHVRIGWTREERWGWAISGLSVVIVLLMAIVVPLGRRRRAADSRARAVSGTRIDAATQSLIQP